MFLRSEFIHVALLLHQAHLQYVTVHMSSITRHSLCKAVDSLVYSLEFRRRFFGFFLLKMTANSGISGEDIDDAVQHTPIK